MAKKRKTDTYFSKYLIWCKVFDFVPSHYQNLVRYMQWRWKGHMPKHV